MLSLFSLGIFGCDGSTDSGGSTADSIRLHSKPDGFFLHPVKPWAYIVRYGQYSDDFGNFLIYDYAAMKVVDSLKLPARLSDAYMAENGFGFELYLICSDSSLYIYDPVTMARKASVPLGDWGSGVTSDSKGTLFVGIGEDSVKAFRRVDLTSGPAIGGDFHGARLWYFEDSLILGMSQFISPNRMYIFSFQHDSLGSGGVSHYGLSDYDWPISPSLVRMSPKRDFFLTGSLGALYSVQPDVFYRGRLPGSVFDFSDFSFSADGGLIYASFADRKEVAVLDRLTLQVQDVLKTAHFSVNIAWISGSLVCLTRKASNEDAYFIEVLGLDKQAVP